MKKRWREHLGRSPEGKTQDHVGELEKGGCGCSETLSLSTLCPPTHSKTAFKPLLCLSWGWLLRGLPLVVPPLSPYTYRASCLPWHPTASAAWHHALRIPAQFSLRTLPSLLLCAHVPACSNCGSHPHPCAFAQAVRCNEAVLSQHFLSSLVNSGVPVPSSRAVPSGMLSLGASTSSPLRPTSFQPSQTRNQCVCEPLTLAVKGL